MRHRAALVLAALLLPGVAFAGDRPALGTATVLATVPAPGYPGPMGFPEGVAVRGHTVYVGASATFGTIGSAPSRVYAFDERTGALLREYPLYGQDLGKEHAVVGMAFDGNGRLYVLDIQRGVVRLDLGSGEEEVYASVPDLPSCSAAPAGAACSPTAVDLPPLPNGIAFDGAGNAYVTDTMQATVWRVPPGGGVATPWLQDAILDTGFGPNGVALTPDRSSIVIGVTTTGGSLGGLGVLYRLPLVDHPTAADLSVFHEYPFEGPDGIAFGASGKLYVTLALSNQISVLAPDGTEETRYDGPAASSAGPIPFDAPASLAFDESTRSLVLTNHALLTGIADHFTVDEVFVDDHADPLEQPMLP